MVAKQYKNKKLSGWACTWWSKSTSQDWTSADM